MRKAVLLNVPMPFEGHECASQFNHAGVIVIDRLVVQQATRVVGVAAVGGDRISVSYGGQRVALVLSRVVVIVRAGDNSVGPVSCEISQVDGVLDGGGSERRYTHAAHNGHRIVLHAVEHTTVEADEGHGNKGLSCLQHVQARVGRVVDTRTVIVFSRVADRLRELVWV